MPNGATVGAVAGGLLGAIAGGTPGALGTIGLQVSAGDSTVRGLVVNQFTGPGIRLDGSGRTTVLDHAAHPRYLSSGHLIFVRDGAPVGDYTLGLGVTFAMDDLPL